VADFTTQILIRIASLPHAAVAANMVGYPSSYPAPQTSHAKNQRAQKGQGALSGPNNVVQRKKELRLEKQGNGTLPTRTVARNPTKQVKT
jgi:hypothetical protein